MVRINYSGLLLFVLCLLVPVFPSQAQDLFIKKDKESAPKTNLYLPTPSPEAEKPVEEPPKRKRPVRPQVPPGRVSVPVAPPPQTGAVAQPGPPSVLGQCSKTDLELMLDIDRRIKKLTESADVSSGQARLNMDFISDPRNMSKIAELYTRCYAAIAPKPAQKANKNEKEKHRKD